MLRVRSCESISVPLSQTYWSPSASIGAEYLGHIGALFCQIVQPDGCSPRKSCLLLSLGFTARQFSQKTQFQLILKAFSICVSFESISLRLLKTIGMHYSEIPCGAIFCWICRSRWMLQLVLLVDCSWNSQTTLLKTKIDWSWKAFALWDFRSPFPSLLLLKSIGKHCCQPPCTQ